MHCTVDWRGDPRLPAIGGTGGHASSGLGVEGRLPDDGFGNYAKVETVPKCESSQ